MDANLSSIRGIGPARLKALNEAGIEIPYNYVKPVDYLQIVDQRFFKENAND